MIGNLFNLHVNYSGDFDNNIIPDIPAGFYGYGIIAIWIYFYGHGIITQYNSPSC